VSTEAVTLLFAWLAVGAELAVAGTAALALAATRGGLPARWFRSFRIAIRPEAVPLALLVAAVATSGSLYLSEVAHFTPCRLCWVQRAFMYPLVPLLAVAVARPAARLRWAALALAAVGGLVSIYHVLLERFPDLETGACDPANPCSLIWVERLGYLTIPAMALSAFALIVTLLLLAGGADTSAGDPVHGQRSTAREALR
jgi:disulfide bond formation protein DsbB